MGSSGGKSKTFYCPLKSNRLVDDSGGEEAYRRIEALSWNQAELAAGKRVQEGQGEGVSW